MHRLNLVGFDSWDLSQAGKSNSGKRRSSVEDLKQYGGFYLGCDGSDSMAAKWSRSGNIFCFCDGRIAFASGRHWLSVKELVEFFASSLDGNTSIEHVARNLRGEFWIYLFKKDESQHFIISDPLGLRPLFFGFSKRGVCWSNTPSSVLDVIGIPREFDKDIVCQFIKFGHALSGRSQYKDVYDVGAACIVHWRSTLPRIEINKKSYLRWSEIRDIGDFKKQDLLTLLDEKLNHYFSRFQNSTERFALGLSGGQDSRLILSYLLRFEIPVETFTFGRADSKDSIIANIVAETADVKNHFFELNHKSDFEDLDRLIKECDSLLDLPHLQLALFGREISEFADLNFDGYLGDAFLGGYYLDRKESGFDHATVLNSNVNAAFSNNVYKDVAELTSFLGRGRNLIYYGGYSWDKYCKQARPFMDLDVLAVTFALGAESRKNNKVYSRFVADYHNQLFSAIPWGRTGRVSSELRWYEREQSWVRSLGRAVQHRVSGRRTLLYPFWSEYFCRRPPAWFKYNQKIGTEWVRDEGVLVDFKDPCTDMRLAVLGGLI